MITGTLNSVPLVIRPKDGSPPFEVWINWRYVDSSNVKRVGWDNAGNMYVEFKQDSMYVYFGVSRQRAVATASAASVGSYIARKIKPDFKVMRVR